MPGWTHPFGDKTEHILAFAVMTFLCLRSRTFLARPAILLPFMVFGALGIEAMQQLFSPSRTASMSDVSASLIGIIAGVVVAEVRGRRLFLALAGLVVFALCTNWAINVGRYQLGGLMTGQSSTP
ncbi:VanZ family protein [Henriciella aquimarina]|uniref:VanZ family protein n=1 Tax=Henriciella aquimarina TaxID=545261 RepID=UPI00117AFBFB|nr:VanZ family protein [Henriciella aquimarina]